MLESFLNQLGTEEWEIVEFRGQPDNPLAFSGLARRLTQRDWTLEDAAKAAAKAEAEKLRVEFEAKFRSATAAAPAAPDVAAEPARAEDDGLRRLRDTEHDTDPEPPEGEGGEDEWDKLGTDDELPTFFEAMRPHLRRNQRGPGFSVGVDYLAKKWDISEDEVIGALKECGLEIPDDENAKAVYVEYDGDLFWVNINRRGELWVNTKEKSRPVFKTVQGTRVEPEEPAPAAAAEGGGRQEERKPRPKREEAERDPGAPVAPLPEGEALLARIRPQMRRNRREPGGSGSISFLSRALKCSEGALLEAFKAMGLALPARAGDPPAQVEIGNEVWWLNMDQRGGVWINAREKRDGQAPGAPATSAIDGTDGTGPAPGNVLAAVRLLLKETKTGSVAAPVERLAGELGKPLDELLGALTASGLRGAGQAQGEAGVCGARGRDFLAQSQREGRALVEREGVKVCGPRGRRPWPGRPPPPSEEEGVGFRRGRTRGRPGGRAGFRGDGSARGPVGASRGLSSPGAAGGDGLRQPGHDGQRLFPGKAGVGDALAPHERDGTEVL